MGDHFDGVAPPSRKRWFLRDIHISDGFRFAAFLSCWNRVAASVMRLRHACLVWLIAVVDNVGVFVREIAAMVFPHFKSNIKFGYRDAQDSVSGATRPLGLTVIVR